MTSDSDYWQDLFSEFGSVTVKRMFGGEGIFFDGLMIALVDDGTLYLKADPLSAARFTQRGLAQFCYVKRGKAVKMSYYLAPEETLDDPQQMKEWAVLAYQAALRAR